jgi:radical SAM superfamily enzyme YgiQ (UPF0313 family)
MKEHGDIPIALTILSAVLKLAGHSVGVFDCSQYVPEISLQSIKESFGMFKPVPPPPVPAPQRRDIRHLHEDLVRAVNVFNADIIGLTVTSGTYSLGLTCSKIIKKHFPNIIVIFGGIHATVCPDEVIKEASVDIICVGEGEDALLELCEALQKKKSINKIKNLWVKDKKEPEVIYKNPLRNLKDLSTLPVQDFSDFNEYDFYRPLDGKTYKMANTDISRGCVFKCSYCSNHFLQELFSGCGNYHRRKDPYLAVVHLKELKDRYQFNAVRFWDEDFTVFPVTYLKELARLYRKEVNLPFIVYAGTRTVTQEKVRYLKEMGCITMAMGIESGNYWMRKYVLNRDISDEDIIKKYKIVKQSGIRVSAYNMIGLPFETREMVFDTINLNRKIKPATSSVTPYLPYPKTRLGEITKEFGLVKKTLDYDSVKTDLDSPHLNKMEVNGLIRTFSLYTKLPKKFFPLLKKCEEDEQFARKTFPMLIKKQSLISQL